MVENVTAITKTTDRPRSVVLDMADRFGMEPAAFEATVRQTCMPSDKDGRVATREEFAAFLLVARDYDLNPITREIYAFPKRGGGIQPIVGVDGWARVINNQPEFDGMEFEDQRDKHGAISAIKCKMFRKDRQHPTEVIEYMAECKRDTATWQQWPARMLRHKAMMQCARYAFGISGIQDQDEYERAELARDVTPRPTRAQFHPAAAGGDGSASTAPTAAPATAGETPITLCVLDLDHNQHRFALDQADAAVDLLGGIFAEAANRSLDALEGMWEGNSVFANLVRGVRPDLGDRIQTEYAVALKRLSETDQGAAEPKGAESGPSPEPEATEKVKAGATAPEQAAPASMQGPHAGAKPLPTVIASPFDPKAKSRKADAWQKWAVSFTAALREVEPADRQAFAKGFAHEITYVWAYMPEQRKEIEALGVTRG